MVRRGWCDLVYTAESVYNLSPAMGTRNQVGIGLTHRPASLCSLASQFQTRFLESIPHPIAGLKFRTLMWFHKVTPCRSCVHCTLCSRIHLADFIFVFLCSTTQNHTLFFPYGGQKNQHKMTLTSQLEVIKWRIMVCCGSCDHGPLK